MAGSNIVVLGIFITTVFLFACMFCFRRWRIHRKPDEHESCSLHPNNCISHLYNMHWKFNLVLIINIFLAYICIPTSMHLAGCATAGHLDTMCPWSLKDLEAHDSSTNSTTTATIHGLPAAGAVAFGFAVIIIEFLLSIWISIMSLKWHSEDRLLKADDEYGHYTSDPELKDDLKYEYQWIRWTRWFTFGVGCWVMIFGFIGRIIIFTLAHSFASTGLPMLDGYSHGELVVVVLFSIVHFFTYLGLCCKRTWNEHHDQNPDYAAFVCSSCNGSKVQQPAAGIVVNNNNNNNNTIDGAGAAGAGGAAPCVACNGEGRVWLEQGVHFSPVPIVDDRFPVDTAEEFSNTKFGQMVNAKRAQK